MQPIVSGATGPGGRDKDEGQGHRKLIEGNMLQRSEVNKSSIGLVDKLAWQNAVGGGLEETARGLSPIATASLSCPSASHWPTCRRDGTQS